MKIRPWERFTILHEERECQGSYWKER